MTCVDEPVVCVADHPPDVACRGCVNGCACRLTDSCRINYDDVCTVHDATEFNHPPKATAHG